MVTDRLAAVRRRMADAAARCGRRIDEVTLVAVSKGRSNLEIMEAYNAGQRHFGENRANELAAKAPELPEDITWHFIGSLQTRQAKIARPHTALLHSLDRTRLINAWAATGAAPPSLLQVNVAGEVQKHGAAPDEAGRLLDEAAARGLSCIGLMTMPPLAAVAEDSREWFISLRELREALQPAHPHLIELSMGMTDDFEVAIEEGATMIRVGRAIFGPLGAPALSD